jgi:hypothetical protein
VTVNLANVPAVHDSLPNRTAAALVAALAAALGCGSDPPPPAKIPTPAEMRTYWGLNPGSCWIYKDLSTQNTSLIVSVDGPDSVRIAGRTVYIVTYSNPAAPGAADELLLDVDTTPGKMFLARSVDRTANKTETYLADPRPLWGELKYEDGALVFAPTGKLESASTPRDAAAAVAHAWTVIARDRMLSTPDGVKPGLGLNYTRDGALTAVYDLVPTFGMAHLQLHGVDHQVCKARVCDAAGTCTGIDSCTNTFCQ